MPKVSQWTADANGVTEYQEKDVKLDGESVGKYRAVRFVKGKAPKTIGEASKALGFTKDSNAIRALLAGRNKMNAGKARAQAKLDALD